MPTRNTFAQRFDRVTVHRTSGDVEDDWYVWANSNNGFRAPEVVAVCVAKCKYGEHMAESIEWCEHALVKTVSLLELMSWNGRA